MISDGARLNLAVIPARGGSKRVPGKNVRPLLGRPLIAYTVDAALGSGLFEDVIVSTDDEEIAEIARRSGARTPFMRQVQLSDDFTPVSLVTVDTLNRLDPDGLKYQHVAQLMANCPLRTAENIRDSYRQFVESRSGSQISVTRFGWQNPWWAMERNAMLTLTPIFESHSTQRSQDLPELFCPTGAIWWANASLLRQEQTFHIANRTGWEMPWERAVDIDTEADWAIAELLMRVATQGQGANG